MPTLSERGKFWPKIVEVAGKKQVIVMLRNSQGKTSPFSTSGRTKKKKKPFGAVEKFEVTPKYVKEELEDIFVFTNVSGEGQLMGVMFDPHSDTKVTEDGKLETTKFGEVLADIERRSGQKTVAMLLNRLIRSDGYFHHNPELHDKEGGFLVENEAMSELSKLKLGQLIEAASDSCEQMDILQNIPSPPPQKKREHRKIKSSRAEIDKVKIAAERETLLTAEAGVNRQSEICHQGIKFHPVKNIVVHSEIIRGIDERKVDDLYEEMKVNLDASQIMFKVQLPIKKHSEFDESMLKDDTLILKAVSGRHRLLAIQKLLEDGRESKMRVAKLLSGDESIEEILVPVVLLSITGTILANYEHLKAEMSNEHSRKIVLQDYVFLYRKLFSKLKDKERCDGIIRNLMVVSTQCSQQTINGVLSVCHLPPEQLESTCNVIIMKEEFKTEGQKKPTFSQRKYQQKQALSLNDLKTIGNTPAHHLEVCNNRLLDGFIGWKEYLACCIEGKKMTKLIAYIETHTQRKLAQLQDEYPRAFANENLKNFIDVGFDIVQKFISNTISQTDEALYDKFTKVQEGNDILRAEPELADVVVMLMKTFEKPTVKWILTALQNINRDPSAVLIVCHNIHEILDVSRVIDSITPVFGITFSNVVHCVKKSSRRRTGYTESLDSVVICGKNCNINLATLSKSPLSVCLMDVIESLHPRKVISISLEHEVFDITSERYQTHYFATSTKEFEKMHKKRKIESQKIRESINETEMSVDMTGDTTGSFERSEMSEESPQAKSANQKQINKKMKRQLSKQLSMERKRVKKSAESEDEHFNSKNTSSNKNEQFLRGNKQESPSIINNSQFSPLSPGAPGYESSPIKKISPDKKSVSRKLFGKEDLESGELNTQKSDLFRHEELSHKIRNKIVNAKKCSINKGEEKVAEDSDLFKKMQLRSMHSAKQSKMDSNDGTVHIPALNSSIHIHRREKSKPLSEKSKPLSYVPNIGHISDSSPHEKYMKDSNNEQDSGIPSSFTPSTSLSTSQNIKVEQVEHEMSGLSLNESCISSHDYGPSAEQCSSIQKDSNSSPYVTEMEINTSGFQSLTHDVKIEDIVKEGIFNLSCIVTKIEKLDLGYVIRIMDGTMSNIYSLCWIDADTQSSTGNHHGFLDIYVSKEVFVEQFGSVDKGTYLRLPGLKCELYVKSNSVEFCDTQGECVHGYKFLFDNGETKVELINARDPRAKTIKKKMAELNNDKLSRIMEEVHYSRHDTLFERRNQVNDMEEMMKCYEEYTDLFAVLGVRECQKVVMHGPSDSIETLKASDEDDSKESTVIQISGEELVKMFEKETAMEILKTAKECIASEKSEMQKLKGILMEVIKNIEKFGGSTDIEVRKTENCIQIVDSDLREGEVLTSLPANVEPGLEILKMSYKEIFLPSNVTMRDGASFVQTKEVGCDGTLTVVIVA